MARYIDADAMAYQLLTIDRQFESMSDWCLQVLDAQPTADVVEVVRCKDCRHSKMADYIPAQCPYYCKLMANCHSGDFFCSMGERREDD